MHRIGHILSDSSCRGNKVSFLWWSRQRIDTRYYAPPVCDHLPTEVECGEWLAEYMKLCTLEPSWGECSPSEFRTLFEKGEIVFSKPMLLTLCDPEDEFKLYHENEFSSPFNVENF